MIKSWYLLPDLPKGVGTPRVNKFFFRILARNDHITYPQCYLMKKIFLNGFRNFSPAYSSKIAISDILRTIKFELNKFI